MSFTYKYSPYFFRFLSHFSSSQFSPVAQSCLTLCDPMNRSTPASQSVTNSQSLLKLMPIESVMPSSHLILCRPFLLLPPIPPSIRVFSTESLFSCGGQSTGASASASGHHKALSQVFCRFSLVIYFTHSSEYISVLISQFTHLHVWSP